MPAPSLSTSPFEMIAFATKPGSRGYPNHVLTITSDRPSANLPTHRRRLRSPIELLGPCVAGVSQLIKSPDERTLARTVLALPVTGSGYNDAVRLAVVACFGALCAGGGIVAGCTFDTSQSGPGGSSTTGSKRPSSSASAACRVEARALRHSTPSQAVRAAVRAAIRADPVISTQGGRVARSPASLDPIAVVRSGSELLPEARRFHREAVRRCGRDSVATRAAWAVVFSETRSVLCCETWTIFVVRTDRGWKSF